MEGGSGSGSFRSITCTTALLGEPPRLPRGLGLDVYQAHWCPQLERRAPLARPVHVLGLDRPVILGEFPSRVSAESLRNIVETAAAAGYEEAYVWSVFAEDKASDFAAAEAILFQGAGAEINEACHPKP